MSLSEIYCHTRSVSISCNVRHTRQRCVARASRCCAAWLCWGSDILLIVSESYKKRVGTFAQQLVMAVVGAKTVLCLDHGLECYKNVKCGLTWWQVPEATIGMGDVVWRWLLSVHRYVIYGYIHVLIYMYLDYLQRFTEFVILTPMPQLYSSCVAQLSILNMLPCLNLGHSDHAPFPDAFELSPDETTSFPCRLYAVSPCCKWRHRCMQNLAFRYNGTKQRPWGSLTVWVTGYGNARIWSCLCFCRLKTIDVWKC